MSKINLASISGHLLIIEVHKKERRLGEYGMKDVLICTIHNVTLNQTFEDAWIWPVRLVKELGRFVGYSVIGRVLRGEAHGDYAAPWIFLDESLDATATAEAHYFLEAREPHQPYEPTEY